MTFGSLLHSFMVDDKLKIVLVLIVVDLVCGVAAAFKAGTFKLSYLANFARDDLLGKVVPWFVIYAGTILVGATKVAGVDLSVLAGGLYAIVVAAMVASILSSLKELGLQLPALKGLTS